MTLLRFSTSIIWWFAIVPEMVFRSQYAWIWSHEKKAGASSCSG